MILFENRNWKNFLQMNKRDKLFCFWFGHRMQYVEVGTYKCVVCGNEEHIFTL